MNHLKGIPRGTLDQVEYEKWREENRRRYVGSPPLHEETRRPLAGQPPSAVERLHATLPPFNQLQSPPPSIGPDTSAVERLHATLPPVNPS